jgi:small subunit ribosomal protein S16
MAAKIKLTRVGAKKQPTYRVVIQEERSKRDGRFIENIGYYNPRAEPATIVINQERVNYWLGVGARPTESVGQLLHIAGITDRYYKRKSAAGDSERPAPAPDTNAPAGSTPGDQVAAVTTEGTGKPAEVSSDKPVEG